MYIPFFSFLSFFFAYYYSMPAHGLLPSIRNLSPANIQFQTRAPRTWRTDINDTQPEPSVSVFHSAWKEFSYALQTHTNTYQRKLNFNFFLGGKQNYLYDTPIKEVDFKFYAQILWSKKLEAVISHEEGFLFSRRKVKFGESKIAKAFCVKYLDSRWWWPMDGWMAVAFYTRRKSVVD